MKYLTGALKMLLYFRSTTPSKSKTYTACYETKTSISPTYLILKNNHIEQVHEHRHHGIITDNKFKLQSWITNVCKRVSKTCSYYSSSNTLWILPNENCFVMLTFLFILFMSLLSGMVVVISYLKKLIHFIGELQSWCYLTHLWQPRVNYSACIYSPVRDKLLFNKTVSVLKAHRSPVLAVGLSHSPFCSFKQSHLITNQSSALT